MLGKTKQIYKQLQDDISKEIFQNRLMYAATLDKKYIDKIIRDLPQRQELDQRVQYIKSLKDKVVFYGAGNDLKILCELYPDLEFYCLCDKSEEKQKYGHIINGKTIPVISPQCLVTEKKDAYVVINTTGFHEEIKAFLNENGILDNQIINLGAITASLYYIQYFEDGIIPHSENEVFVDGGCYDGNTFREFVKWCGGRYKKIYSFEPDEKNYLLCKEKLSAEPITNLKLYNKGLWDCETELCFAMTGGQGSRIKEGESGICKIQTAALDEVISSQDKVTFLKLDVEGAELKTLMGAKEIIKRDRPNMALCIYHKPEDIIEIAGYILQIHPDYKLYIRHYQLSEFETILYAI